jgi:hypothetical protein
MIETEKTIREHIEETVEALSHGSISAEEAVPLIEEAYDVNISSLQEQIYDLETDANKVADSKAFQQRYNLGLSKKIERPYEMLEEIAVLCRKAGYPLGYGTPLDQVRSLLRSYEELYETWENLS